jgi:hypothetical protein
MPSDSQIRPLPVREITLEQLDGRPVSSSLSMDDVFDAMRMIMDAPSAVPDTIILHPNVYNELMRMTTPQPPPNEFYDDSIDFDEVERYSKWIDLQREIRGMQLEFDFVWVELKSSGRGPEWFDQEERRKMEYYHPVFRFPNFVDGNL